MQKQPPFPSPTIATTFQNFPAPVAGRLLALRKIVLDVAAENAEIGAVEETLKWGEPAYLTKGGSTIRMGAKDNDPEYYRLFFHCQTTLIDSFKQLYPYEFCFEGNRAIKFHKEDALAVDALKQCIFLALTYHSRKHLPLLGA